jgi:hypothetical protein
MGEICASGSVGGEGGNALAYPASTPASLADPLCATRKSPEVGHRNRHSGSTHRVTTFHCKLDRVRLFPHIAKVFD